MVLAAVAIAIGAYWYESPFLAIHNLREAGARGDAAGVSEHVDYAALRENLKAQFADRVAGAIGKPESNPISALGTALGMVLANPVIDALVRPETVMQAMATGRLRPGAPPTEPAASRDEPGGEPAHWRYERFGADRVVAYPREDAGSVGLQFERRGFADWKLTGILAAPAPAPARPAQ